MQRVGERAKKIQVRRTTTTSESIRNRTGFHSWMQWSRGKGSKKKDRRRTTTTSESIRDRTGFHSWMRRGEGGQKKNRIEGQPQPVRASGAEPAFTPGCGGGREGPFTPGCRPSLSHRLFPDRPVRTQNKTRISKRITKQTIVHTRKRDKKIKCKTSTFQ
jgi:tetrahydromethanopterin S-methyltransferase subunit F